jgi:hypothetical protein
MIMKVLLLPIITALVSISARGDGLPFDPETQRVSVPSLRLKLNSEQIKEISSKGILTFDSEQLQIVKLFYPAATSRTHVVAATFNDNTEGWQTPCFWVAADEVAITLDKNHPKNKSPFSEVESPLFPSDEELENSSERFIRLSPEGTIFFRGEEITLSQAFRLIDDLANNMTSNPTVGENANHGTLSVTIPPPRSKNEEEHDRGQGRLSPKQIFEALVVYGESKSIGVGNSW